MPQGPRQGQSRPRREGCRKGLLLCFKGRVGVNRDCGMSDFSERAASGSTVTEEGAIAARAFLFASRAARGDPASGFPSPENPAAVARANRVDSQPSFGSASARLDGAPASGGKTRMRGLSPPRGVSGPPPPPASKREAVRRPPPDSPVASTNTHRGSANGRNGISDKSDWG